MVAAKLITYDIPPLNLSDNGEKALEWMEEFKVTEMPVVDDGKFLGLVNESLILDNNDVKDTLKNYQLNYYKIFVQDTQHLFDVIIAMVENECTVIPVVDAKENYRGLITAQKVINALSQMVAIGNHGSIITLELNSKDYSLVEISKLVESDNAKILASYITSLPDASKLEITLKINKTDITRILHTFERFNYTVTASYHESEYHKDLKNRYDAFMRFLKT